MLRTVLIDLGETLVHLDRPWDDVFTADLISLHSYLKERGLKLDFGKFAKAFISVFENASATADFYKIEVPMQSIISKALGKIKFKDCRGEQLRQAVIEFYAPEIGEWNLFPDTVQTLTALKNNAMRLGLISNTKSEWLVYSILKRTELQDFFTITLTSAEMGIRKPRAEIFERALAMIGSRPNESVFIGDSMNADVIGAKLAGMRAIHVRRRPPVNTLAHPDATVGSLSEALKQIIEWKASLLDRISVQ